MGLLPNTERDALRDAVRALVTDHASSAQVRAAAASELGYDTALWHRLGRDLRVLGLTVPEQYGGGGAGHTERAVVAEELGRALVPSPFLGSTVLAVDTLWALSDDAAHAELLPALVTGELIAALAVAEDGGSVLDPHTATIATKYNDGGWVLDGTKTPVVDGDTADVLLVFADSDDGPGLFRVDADADGLVRTRLQTLDITRRMARIDLAGVEAVRLDGDPNIALAHATLTAAVALGAEQVGGMGRALELTVDYARTREQFGRPIGAYQAVKHGCADMYCAHELTTAVLRHACWTADHQPADLARAAALLSAYAGPAYFDVSRAMIQYHGGVGYTWEHDAHLFYRRAKSDELLLGGPTRARAELATVLGI